MEKSFVGQWPSGSEHWVPTLLQLTIPFEGDGELARSALRTWFESGFGALGGDLRVDVLNSLPHRTVQGEPTEGTTAALYFDRVGPRGYEEVREEYSSTAWHEFLSKLEDLPQSASLEVQRVNKFGVPVAGPSMIVAARRFGRACELLSLAIMIKPQLRPQEERWGTALSLLKSIAEETNPSYGSVSFLDTIASTSLEIGHVSPEETVPRSRERLRGYGWITIIAEEIGLHLGGKAGLRATGAFAEVLHLRNGGFWLKATAGVEEYRAPQAEKVRSALARVLPNAGCV